MRIAATPGASSPGPLPQASVVIDVGKTHAKLTLFDADGHTLAEQRRLSRVLAATDSRGYPHHDSEGLWTWMLSVMSDFGTVARIGSIVPVTHGATAALVDEQGLVLPIMDYEFDGLGDDPGFAATYAAQRPDFAQSASPALPAGLNLGRQLAWLARNRPIEFARCRHVLLYPQYWAWRLSGVAASELTSLGCHTDLWTPPPRDQVDGSGDYSGLVDAHGWRPMFPPLRPAWARLGALRPELAAATGLPAECQILCGIHDSNASLLRHLLTLNSSEPCTVLSTGTWVIAASLGGAANGHLDESQDMLANCDILGRPVPCMRFMGGREFGAIAGTTPSPFGTAELRKLIEQRTLALPSFAEAGGPFARKRSSGHIKGPSPESPPEHSALATLYVALMADYCLEAMAVEARPVVVEGAFSANAFFGPLLAGLRDGRKVTVSHDSSGTAFGGWLLVDWANAETRAPAAPQAAVPSLNLPGWRAYRDAWRSRLD